MFRTLLIANRGEIACRIARTARRLGVRVAAVYSRADAGALHVRVADEALLIGPSEPRESYLSIERVIAAALRTGAQAIHPGYGFLSENPQFADACAQAGLVFIGPTSATLRAMGAKAAAKALMQAAGVPVVPGYHGEDQHDARLLAEAQQIGFPVLIKASAGGGGKGMRVVERGEAFGAALSSCRREAENAFGDARMLIEKYIPRPRHVEVQVFGDTHGNLVHLHERDCSMQRRYQKVVEEAPAPDLPAALRASLARAAVDAARAVGYVGAGTVEFIVAPDGAFHFMEMNTRLQVEHPVTEMITGLDLVEWQLRVAAGEPLPLVQEQVAAAGHAFEARICAEDPARAFLPSGGTLVRLALPAESTHVRVDSGVAEGDAIGTHYDSMIAKLIVWDDTRERARMRMLGALAQLQVAGVASNAGFLMHLFASGAFAAARLDTGLIERESAALLEEPAEMPHEVWLVAALATLLRERRLAMQDIGAAGAPWNEPDSFRLNAPARRRLLFRIGQTQAEVGVEHRRGHYVLEIAGRRVEAGGELLDRDELRVDLGGTRLTAAVVVAGEQRHVFLRGRSWTLVRVDPLFVHADPAGGEGGLLAPMPGRVIALLSSPGTVVEAGAPLLILEAMKMEHTIRATVAGTVRAYRYAVGEQVDDGAELVDFAAAPPAASGAAAS